MKVGDHVSVIADTIKGIVIQISDEYILIEDEFGFERTFNPSELVLIQGDYKLSEEKISKEIEEKIKIQLEEEKHQLKSFEIDLHIEELIDSHANMTNHEILTKQMTTCRSFIQNAINKGNKKVVLIHGKGQGVLKSEIYLFLNKLKNLNGVNLDYHDASFTEYGMGGATEVIFY